MYRKTNWLAKDQSKLRQFLFLVQIYLAFTTKMIHYLFLFSRQGKVRLQKWFVSYSDKEKKKILREVMALVLARKPKMSSFLEWKDMKLVYRRYLAAIFSYLKICESLFSVCN